MKVQSQKASQGNSVCVCLVTQSCPTLGTLWTGAPRLLCPWEFSGKNTGVGCHSFLQGIFPTQGLNWHPLCLLHCRQNLYLLSHWGILPNISIQFSSVAQSCPTVTPWTAACQASLSITSSRSLLKLMSIELMPSNHLILCCPLFLLPSTFPSIRVFSNGSPLCIGGQSIGVSASTSIEDLISTLKLF